MADRLIIPIATFALETSIEEEGRVEYLVLKPEGGVSGMRLPVAAVRDGLRHWLRGEPSGKELLEALMGLQGRRLVVKIGKGGGYVLDLAPSNAPPTVVSLEHRSAPRKKPENAQVTVERETAALSATVTDVSTDGEGCALECDEAALQALLASNVFCIGPWNQQGEAPPPRIEIEVRSVTRSGDRFRVGCHVTGGSDRIKGLLS